MNLLQTNNANERIFNRFIREGVGPSATDCRLVRTRILPRPSRILSSLWNNGRKGELSSLLWG